MSICVHRSGICYQKTRRFEKSILCKLHSMIVITHAIVVTHVRLRNDTTLPVCVLNDLSLININQICSRRTCANIICQHFSYYPSSKWYAYISTHVNKQRAEYTPTYIQKFATNTHAPTALVFGPPDLSQMSYLPLDAYTSAATLSPSPTPASHRTTRASTQDSGGYLWAFPVG